MEHLKLLNISELIWSLCEILFIESPVGKSLSFISTCSFLEGQNLDRTDTFEPFDLQRWNLTVYVVCHYIGGI